MRGIVLIRPLCRSNEPEFQEPLGIERLAGYLLAHGIDGHDVLVLDRRLYQEERRQGICEPGKEVPFFWDDLETAYPQGEEGPAFIGLSLMTADDIPDSLQIISRISSLYPKARVLVGGLLITTGKESVAKHFPKNVELMAGEGEQALLSLVKDGGRCPSVSNPVSPDEWAFAYRPNLERYARLGCATSIQTSRGCMGKCTFCATPQLPEPLCRWNPRGIELVADEIAGIASRLERAGLPAMFNIVDDDFGPLNRVERLAKALQKRNARIAFSLEMRMAHLAGQKDLLQRLIKLKEAGLIRVFIGLESLDVQVMQRWKKDSPVSELSTIVEALRKAKVQLQLGYILWHRDSTIESARREMGFMHEQGLYSHRMALSSLLILPGSLLARKAGTLDSGIVEEPDSLEASFFRQWFASETAPLTEIWLKAAIALPTVASIAHLKGDCSQLEALEAIVERCNEASYRIFMDQDDGVDIHALAAGLSQELDRIEVLP